MNARQVQYFGSIEIADAGNRPLIEQGHFDGPTTRGELRLEVTGRKRQCIGAKLAATELSRELSFTEQPHRAQPAAVPIPNMRNWSFRKVEPKAQVILRRRIGHEHQPRHPGLEDQTVAAVNLQNN